MAKQTDPAICSECGAEIEWDEPSEIKTEVKRHLKQEHGMFAHVDEIGD